MQGGSLPPGQQRPFSGEQLSVQQTSEAKGFHPKAGETVSTPRKAETFCEPMDQDFGQPMDTTDCSGSSSGIHTHPSRSPPPLPCPSASLSEDQTATLDKEIEELLQKEAIEPISGPGGFYSPIFTIPKKDGGWRPIINLKRLNSFLSIFHFKMESIRSLRDLQRNQEVGRQCRPRATIGWTASAPQGIR